MGDLTEIDIDESQELNHDFRTFEAFDEACNGRFADKFKNWKAKTASRGTARTYWSKAKGFPYFELMSDNTLAINGAVEAYLAKPEKSPGHLTAIKSLMTFLYQEWESEGISDVKRTLLKIKTQGIMEQLEMKETSKSTGEVNVKQKHIHANNIVKMLKKCEPKRARMWYILYACGMRIGELKRVGPTHLKSEEEYPPHGALKIPSEDHRGENISKSESGRTYQFRNDLTRVLLQDAPTGTWEEDQNGVGWENVFYPEMYSQLENHYMKKYTSNPNHGVGIERRTPHCFRHSRITHLIHDTELSKTEVAMRVGHDNEATTNNYIETEFDRPPQTVESYCEENDIRISTTIESTVD